MYSRIVLVLADGLRPDAITPAAMPSLYSLGHDYTRALHAHTVRPSATVAALASLACGAGPHTHRLTHPNLAFLPRLPKLDPLARRLDRAGLESVIVGGELPLAAGAITRALTAAAGISELVLRGQSAREIAAAARARRDRLARGLLMVYLPDCDRAGHADGWMSPAYFTAASEVDRAIADLASSVRDELLIVVSDHGGGGVTAREHDQPHPVNSAIPLVLAGPSVKRGVITKPVSLLDVPATVLWAFGLDVPSSYEGQPLREAFVERAPARARI
jgi:membrane-anchored protein YejM (alkaline phosphatase superfamily)